MYAQINPHKKLKIKDIMKYTGVNYNKLKFLDQTESVIRKLLPQLMLLLARHIKKSLT